MAGWEAFLAQSCPISQIPGCVRPRLFPRGEPVRAARPPGPRAGRVPSAGGVGPRGSRAPRRLASPPPCFLPPPEPGHRGACLAGSHPLPHPPFPGGRRLPSPPPHPRVGGALGSGSIPGKTAARNFPGGATFPHLGDGSARGGEVRASSL